MAGLATFNLGFPYLLTSGNFKVLGALMSTSSVGNFKPASTPRALVSDKNQGASIYSLDPDRMIQDNDPLISQLTTDDRAQIKATTGIDVRADGSIGCPVSMSASDYGKACEVTRRIAVDRQSGAIQAPITRDYMVELFKEFQIPEDGLSELAPTGPRVDQLG